ncbi:MAG: ATP-binding cassette domain-containing protein [Lachnospiraceae bacterium]|nr:ATP-binding cassette domain-containing protein [Lachnospiraceae bacterium]
MLKVRDLVFRPIEDGVEKTIIDKVSFDVNDGELLVITGPNGGGKSTLAKILMGIIKEDEGQIIFNDKDITSLDINERAKEGIGFAFQQPPRFKGMTVKRLLTLAAGGSLSEINCCDLLSSVGLCAREYLDREVDGTLSGGEMKRIEIASVLATGHKLCIFDEPEAGIDLWSFSMLVKQFEKLHKNSDQSIIIISHQERIIEMADRIMVIKDGKVQGIGTKDEVYPVLVKGETHACMSEN